MGSISKRAFSKKRLFLDHLLWVDSYYRCRRIAILKFPDRGHLVEVVQQMMKRGCLWADADPLPPWTIVVVASSRNPFAPVCGMKALTVLNERKRSRLFHLRHMARPADVAKAATGKEMKLTICRLLFLVLVVAVLLAIDRRVESKAKELIYKIEKRDEALRISKSEFQVSIRGTNWRLQYETSLFDRFYFQ